jgi:hypothetical protein
MSDQSGSSTRFADIYSQVAALACATLPAWFLLPMRNLQIWQEAWARLLPR